MAVSTSTLSPSQPSPVGTPRSSRIVNPACISEAIHSALKNGAKSTSFPELSEAASIALYMVEMIQSCQEGRLRPKIFVSPILHRNYLSLSDLVSGFLQTNRWTRMVLYHIKYRSQFKRLQRRINQSIAKFEVQILMSVDIASVLSELQEYYDSKSDQASKTGGINQEVQINSGTNGGILINEYYDNGGCRSTRAAQW
ncbi:hypothetical protein B0H34DRAFT_676206 [Crassisporium funariophilum]|nr:hypothetical protein B0H34DRAFT_676206 [Crassisporium funariophilum]